MQRALRKGLVARECVQPLRRPHLVRTTNARCLARRRVECGRCVSGAQARRRTASRPGQAQSRRLCHHSQISLRKLGRSPAWSSFSSPAQPWRHRNETLFRFLDDLEAQVHVDGLRTSEGISRFETHGVRLLSAWRAQHPPSDTLNTSADGKIPDACRAPAPSANPAPDERSDGNLRLVPLRFKRERIFLRPDAARHTFGTEHRRSRHSGPT